MVDQEGWQLQERRLDGGMVAVCTSAGVSNTGARLFPSLEDLKKNYPVEVARRMAEALLTEGVATEESISKLASESSLPLPATAPRSNGPRAETGVERFPTVKPGPNGPQSAVGVETLEQETQEEGEFGAGPWIDEEFCTACGDCMKINPRLFIFRDSGKATITDPSLGTYADLVRAEELCPSRAIHPGEPLNKKEKNLEKWLERAAPFNESVARDEHVSERAFA
jgi:ferredoxin